MRKMQPVHRYTAYVLCGVLLAVILGALLKNEPLPISPSIEVVSISEDHQEAEEASIVENAPEFYDEDEFVDITAALSIKNIDDLDIEKNEVEIEFDGQLEKEESAWDNPFFPFSELALFSDIQSDLKHVAPLKGKIAIIIDDMGIDMVHSYALMDMEGPFTLSFLPYAEKLDSQTEFAAKNNHTLMIHMPMEAVSGSMMDTPGLLKVATSPDEFEEQLESNLSKIKGYTGLNNHMGSRLTQDEEKMTILMRKLKAEGYYFVDSRTISTSIAADIAEQEGVPYLIRDVFLDHDPSLEAIRKALLRTEAMAVRKGVAIAIGHPKEATVQAIREWIPTLKAKGFELITIDQLIEDTYPDFTIKKNDDFSVIAAPHQDHITVLSIFD